MQLDIATGFYASESVPFAAQRCVNWRPIVAEGGALSESALFDVWGIEAAPLTGISGINRGGRRMAGVPYWVNGQNLYSFDRDHSVTDHGTIVGNGRVSMAHNGQYLVIVVPGITAYAFNNEDSTLTEIVHANFVTADTVSFKDGYFIFTASDGEIFFVSSLNNPLEYSALDFGSAEVRPDKIVASHVNRNELFVAGDETIELFQTISTADFPFQRVPGGNIQKGVYAKHSLTDFDNSFVFVGGDVNEAAAIWKVTGAASVVKISTAAIDHEIQKYSREEVANCYAMTRAFSGNFLVYFTFTSSNRPSRTFVYDATSSAHSGGLVWYERQSGVDEGKWRVTDMVTAYGQTYVGDSIDGRIGIIKRDVYTEYGERIHRYKTSRPFTNGQTPFFNGSLRLTMDAGQGLIDTDPQVELRFSDDGARTWSNGFWRSYGAQGEYQELPEWRRLGRIPRNRTLRFYTSEPIKSHLLRLDAE